MILKNTFLYAPEQEGGSGSISSSEISGQELVGEGNKGQEKYSSQSETESTLLDSQGYMTQDPEYIKIKEELNAQWLQEKGVEPRSAAHQDYLFGNILDKNTTTLEQDTEKAFREQFPEIAQEYDENERVRIYHNIDNDPAYKKLYKRAIRATNTDKDVQAALKSGSPSDFRNSWARTNSAENVNAIFDFVTQYPEKAKAYADRWDRYVNENPTTSEMSNEEWVAWCNDHPDALSVDEYRRVARISEYVKKNQEDQNQSPSLESIESTEVQDLDAILNGIEISTEKEPSILEDALDSAEQAIKSPELPFPISEETGLSYQGETIDELKKQLQVLESRADINLEAEITEARREAYTQIEQALTLAQTDLDDTLSKINARLNTLKANDSKITLTTEDFINSTPALKDIVDTKEASLRVSQQTFAEFESETQRLIDEAYETAIKELKERLEPLQDEYAGSEAEQYDKKVLLEQKLESSLTKPEELLSDAHIAEILAVYGLQEGKERIQQLQEQSKEAQEQDTRDMIKKRYINNIYMYLGRGNNQDLALINALNQDIKLKLEELQQTNPESENIRDALKDIERGHLTDPSTLVNYGDPQLNQLAFWYNKYRNDRSDSEILTEYPHFAQYVEKTVNTQWEEQNKQKDDFKVQREQRIQEGINARIEDGVSRYKKQEVTRIQGEISTIQNDEVFYSQDRKDRSIVQSKEAIRLTNMNEFKASMQSGVEGITINEGRFIIQNDIAEANKQIDEEMLKLLTELQKYVTAIGYEQGVIGSLDKLDTFGEQITNELATESKRLFKDKAKITQLTAVQKQIEEVKGQRQILNNQKIENERIFRQRLARVTELNAMVGRLPQYIKETLMTSPINNMSERLDALVQELQQYETPAEVQAQRSKIAQLQQQIEELQSVT